MTGTIVYDADCGFCTRSAEFLGRRRECALRPWQSVDLEEAGARRGRRHHRGVLGRGRPYAEPRGARDRGDAADVPRCGLPGAGRLIDLPPVRPVAGWVYGLVARYRYERPAAPTPAGCPISALAADFGRGVTMLFISKCIGSV